jgi:putative peptide zinc metalloprotease protein
LAIRLPGVNPTRWLDRIVPRAAWIVSPVCRVLYIVLVLSSLALVFSQFDELAQRLPRFRDFFSGGNLPWLAISLAVVKSLHELGHAFACKYYGGECNRIGVMLIAFTPALYCDVTDAWLLPHRRQRIAVSGAGILVELGLAAAATWLWAATQPGVFNSLCLNVMFVCSVGTLLINGNPLLRFDGYYIFADWLEAPNLQQQASDAFYRVLGRLAAGIPEEPRRVLAEPPLWLLLSYTILSALYRTVVILGLLWLVFAALAPRGLAVVAQTIIVLVLLALVAGPAMRLWRFLAHPESRMQVNRMRLAGSLAAAALLAALAISIPLPHRVAAPVTLRPAGVVHVYVTTPGLVASAIAPGRVVASGEALARLENRELEAELATLAARRDGQRLHLKQLKVRQFDDPSLGDHIPAATEALADLEEQLAELQERLDELELIAPVAGAVLPPRNVTHTLESDGLPAYSGTPLDEENVGCYLETGTLLCTLADPGRFEAVALVEESDAAGVCPGQQVRLLFPLAPGAVVSGVVERIARGSSIDLPPELVAAGLLPVEQRPGQPVRPLGVYYEAIIRLEQEELPLLTNAPGQARISVAPQSLGRRLYGNLRRTVRWPW